MRDYWLTQELLKAAGFGYIAVCLIALGVALWLPKRWWGKVIAAAVVLAIATILPLQAKKEIKQEQVQVDDFKQRQAKAKALFDERCKTAGEKIYKTVEGVESVELIGTRGSFDIANYADANWKYAGFPGESSGSQYIAEFLYYHKPRDGQYARSLGSKPDGKRGYPAVFTSEDGQIYRYQLLESSKYVNDPDPLKAYASKEFTKSVNARFSVVYEDISKPNDRLSWIAGGKVMVIDRKDNSVIGEFIRYAFEPGLGNTHGERSPWAFSMQCPVTSYGGRTGHIRSFVEQVIIPKQGD
jgi:hypothetical protein